MANVTLPNVFSDHAVLQRDIPVPIWGTADAGEKITVRFAGQTKTATAGPDGRWRVALSPMKAGGPYTLQVNGKDAVTREDILVGDVWICSGQSNMGTTMGGAQWWMSECPGANFPQIRFMNMGGNGGRSAAEPQSDTPDKWYPCTPATSMGFSALGYFFAKGINRELGVPIGMIKCSSWGSPAEPFVSVPAMRGLDLFKPQIDKLDADVAEYQKHIAEYDKVYNDQLAAYRQKVDDLNKQIADNDLGLKEHWENPATNTNTWTPIRMPGSWEVGELKGQAGAIWFRKDTFAVNSWVGKDVFVQLGGQNGDATLYFNGVEVGHSSPDTDAMGFRVPAELVKPGGNTVVVRLVDYTPWSGRLGSNEFLMYMAPIDGGNGDERMPMPGEWRVKAGYTFPRTGMPQEPSPRLSPAAQAAPGSLYNAMLAPIAGYGIKGVLWYQGESNADRAKAYETLFPLLITSWRKDWGQDFAFLWVQLPNYINNGKPGNYREPAPNALPGELPLGWAAIREAQVKSLAVPNTGMVVTIDIGETWDIHPNNKFTVADRLIKAALGGVYGKKIAYTNPLYKGMKVEGSKIRISFTGADGGLVAKGGDLKQFAIAGDDKQFVWAQAKIEGNTVVVWSDAVKKPVAVRYAFHADPQGVNLYNAAGLPASPFRTDDWDITVK